MDKVTLGDAVNHVCSRMRDALNGAVLGITGSDREAIGTLMSAISRDGRLRGILQGPILASGAVAGSREARYGLDDAVENVYGHVQDAMYRACCESCDSVQAMPSLMTALRRDARVRPMLHTSSPTRRRTRCTGMYSKRTARSGHRNKGPSVGRGRRSRRLLGGGPESLHVQPDRWRNAVRHSAVHRHAPSSDPLSSAACWPHASLLESPGHGFFERIPATGVPVPPSLPAPGTASTPKMRRDDRRRPSEGGPRGAGALSSAAASLVLSDSGDGMTRYLSWLEQAVSDLTSLQTATGARPRRKRDPEPAPGSGLHPCQPVSAVTGCERATLCSLPHSRVARSRASSHCLTTRDRKRKPYEACQPSMRSCY